MSDQNGPCYLLFYGFAYYPVGGWHDFKGFYLSIDDAMAAYSKTAKQLDGPEYDWGQVIDAHSLKCVKHWGATCYADGEPPYERE